MERAFQVFLIYRLPKVIDGSNRLYDAAGSLINKKTIIAFPLLLVLILPLSAYAESFTLTTNKDVYTTDEKARIVGIIPEDAPDGHAVQIRVTGPGGRCATQHVLPTADNSFISKPVALEGCGLGEFVVTASYADLTATSTFIISTSSQADAGTRLELRTLKNIMLQAQEVVNERVKALIESGYVLPEGVASTYSAGVTEASLALQAIEFGDTAEAKRHMILAIGGFRQVLDALSEENLARFEQTAEQKAENEDNSDVMGKYRIMRDYYYRLVDLADKNDVERQDDFDAAAKLLANAKEMIEEENFGGAETILDRVNTLLEAIRADLLDERNEEQFATYTNGTSPEEEASARRLIEAADRFEKKALELVNATGSDTEAQTKVQEALSLIANARASIEENDLDTARESLTAAYWAIEEAKDLIEDDENSGEDSGSSSTGNGSEGNDSESSGDSDGEKDGDSENVGDKIEKVVGKVVGAVKDP